VVELINGERVGIKSDLSPEDYNIVMHVLQGHGRVYGTWLFARRSSEQSKYRVKPPISFDNLLILIFLF
jgi:hypothetical protein